MLRADLHGEFRVGVALSALHGEFLVGVALSALGRLTTRTRGADSEADALSVVPDGEAGALWVVPDGETDELSVVPVQVQPVGVRYKAGALVVEQVALSAR